MPAPHKVRPAETAGAAAGTGGVIASIASHNWLALGLAAIGYIPAAVTFLVSHGGIAGLWRSLVHGRS